MPAGIEELEHDVLIEIDEEFVFLGMSKDGVVFGDSDGDTIKIVITDKQAALKALDDIRDSIEEIKQLWDIESIEDQGSR